MQCHPDGDCHLGDTSNVLELESTHFAQVLRSPGMLLRTDTCGMCDLFFRHGISRLAVKFQKPSILFRQLGDITAFKDI